MGHTHRNLRLVKDSAPDYGLSEIQEARFARGELDATGIRNAEAVISVGEPSP